MGDGNWSATGWEDWFDKAAVVVGKCLETVVEVRRGGKGFLKEQAVERRRLVFASMKCGGREHECDLETWEVAMCVVTVMDTTRVLGQVPDLDLGSPELLEDVEV